MKRNYVLAIWLSLVLLFAVEHADAQCSTPTTVPYHEDFSSVTTNNQLPACWLTAGPGNTYFTYTTSGGYGGFGATPTGATYFFTRSLQLNAGVTYSAGLFYKVDVPGSVNWMDLSVLINNNQSSVGASTVVSSNGPVVHTSYTPLSHSFSVATTGVYYLVIRATSTSGSSQYLYYDDVFVSIPCGEGHNAPTLTVTANPSVACVGQQVTLTASGANSYSWSVSNSPATGSSSVFVNAPVQGGSTVYSVSGTNSLSGCTSTASKTISVIAPVLISAFSDSPNNSVCKGMPIVVHGIGTATSYTWAGAQGTPSASATFTPLANSVYTVLGSGATSSCIAQATIGITVMAPTLNATSTNTILCVGQSATLTAQGASSYTWTAGGNSISSQTLAVTLTTTTEYTLSGTDSDGCANTATITQLVQVCQSIPAISYNSKISVFPNPNSGVFTIELSDVTSGHIDITDLSGRVIMSQEVTNERSNISLGAFANGMYYVRLRSANAVEMVKIVKQ